MTLKSTMKAAVVTKCGVLLFAGFLSLSAYAQEHKIAYVSYERVSRDAAPFKAAAQKIEQEFSRRQKELQEMAARIKGMAEKLDKDAPVLPESERIKRQRELAELDRDFQRKQREYREDYNERHNQELAAVLEKAYKVIKQVAEAEKYDIVIQEAIYFSPRVDITDKVLKALNASK